MFLMLPKIRIKNKLCIFHIPVRYALIKLYAVVKKMYKKYKKDILE